MSPNMAGQVAVAIGDSAMIAKWCELLREAGMECLVRHPEHDGAESKGKLELWVEKAIAKAARAAIINYEAG